MTAAELCIHHRKLDSGCLGYPTVLLLFCTVEALGNYLSPKKPLAVLNHPLFGKSYSAKRIENLEGSINLPDGSSVAPFVVKPTEM